MSRIAKLAPSTTEDSIEPGKRLIRAGDDRALSLFERLGVGLHRLSWRTPFHSIRLRGRAPLRLLAVPKDPIAGNKVVGESLLSGFAPHGRSDIDLATLDFASPHVGDWLHSFAWLRDLAAAATRERGAPVAELLTRRWLEAHADTVSEPAWRADLWGRRILFWAAYAPYILSSRDPAYRTQVLRTLSRGARHVERTADKAGVGVPRIASWAGVIASALVVQGGPARLKSGETGLERALGTGLHDDGGLVSRSPAEQVVLVELLAQLRAVYLAGERDLPEWLADALERSVAALMSATLGDDALSSWQGGNMGRARRIAAAIEGSGVQTRALRQARGWGYQRLQAKTSVLVFDAAPPPPPKALSGGCASTLAFEFSEGANRIIVNCGGVAEVTAGLPDSLVQALRTTAAHSTLTIGDRNSTAIHEDGSLGKGVIEVELVRDETGGLGRLEASHDGYVRRFGLVHERRLNLSSDGRTLTGEDRLIPAGKRKRSEPVGFTARFHLAPNVEVTRTADGQGALLRLRGTSVWQFRCRGGQLDIEESLWIDGDAQPRATSQLAVTGEAPADGITLSWELKRAG